MTPHPADREARKSGDIGLVRSRSLAFGDTSRERPARSVLGRPRGCRCWSLSHIEDARDAHVVRR